MNLCALVLALLATPNTETSRDPVILDFHAAWCGPCQQMRPAVELLIEKGYPVKSVDIDRAKSLAQRYQVSSVPTFVVVDAEGHELDRTSGLQPASQLAALYKQAKTKAARHADPQRRAKQPDDAEKHGATNTDDAPDTNSDAPQPPSLPALPKPWETVVRICVDGNGMLGYGSGTIISSSPEESIILTCAHIFKIDGARVQPTPARFPRRITVDLFDGKLHGRQPAMVHRAASVAGEAVDYDFSSDVGLIRIRPGRRLPAARVVPPNWRPQPKMEMVTVGCSEGHDATAWTTWIINPHSALRVGGRDYAAIECVHAPKEGRSGGGLYTPDGHVAGVCDFAEPVGNRGLYAAPESIYKLLDRNRLMALYDPKAGRPDTLLAHNRPERKPSQASTLRAQSPDHNEAKQVTLPAPELLGIKTPAVTTASTQTKSKGKTTWHTSPGATAASDVGRARTVARGDGKQLNESDTSDERPIPVEIKLAPDDDGFAPPAPGTEGASAPRTPATKPAGPTHWRAVTAISPN